MAAIAYRLVGPDPQVVYWLCDTEEELLACPARPGDTGYAKNLDVQYVRSVNGWRVVLSRPS